MPIIVNIDVMLARRKMSSGELAEKMGITPANLSILKTGKARAVRFSTLEAICRALECQPDLSDALSEWYQCQLCQLEMLHAERDTYDGYEKQQGKHCMGQREFDAPEEDPQHVEQYADTSHASVLELRCLAEREHGHYSQFHELVPERNPDDGDAEHQTHNDIPHP